jgi:hypothetical protein
MINSGKGVGKMVRQKVGLVLYWMAVVWAFAWGIVASFMMAPFFRTLTFEELNRTAWAVTGPLFILWGLGGVPLAVVVAAVGILLYSGAKGSSVWKYGIGLFLGLCVGMTIGFLGYIPLLFGIGGTLILLFFVGILWLWARERRALEGSGTTAADLRLAGYAFFLMASWFTCGIASQPFMKATADQTPGSPIHVMAFFVLGWLFLFLSHRRSR